MADFDQGPTQATLNWYPCKNAGSKVIPAHGICQIDAPDGAELRDERRLILLVKQPDKLGFTSSVMVNGPIPIQPGQDGVVTDGRIVVAAYDKKAESVPEKGQIWGPQQDSSFVRRHIPGGRVLRDGEKGRVILLRYEHYDVVGELTEELVAGGTAAAKLMYVDPTNTTILQEVESGAEQVRFDVSEALDDDFETLDAGDRIIGRYDETFGGYIVRGWVC